MRLDRGFHSLLLVAIFGLATHTLASEDRPGTIDEILLIDKSLSMRGAMATVKDLAASDLVESILVPGDRLIVEAFYGKIDRVFAGTIRTDADKQRAAEAIRAVVADGAYTDIGAVLDKASEDLAELGMPDRPKYVVLLTDERQEAPPGSRYVSPDYRLTHPALTYVRKIDRGAFREIIVGLDVAAKVDQAAPAVMKILEEPPARSDADFPPLPENTPAGLKEGIEAPASAATTNVPAAGGFESSRPGMMPSTGLLVGISSAVALAAAVVVTLVLIGRRKRRDRELHDS